MKVRKLFTQAFLILTVFGLALNAAQAQNSIRLVTVKGHITDSNGEPLAGVSVMVPSSTTGVTSDSEGDYLIRVGEGCQLNYSFIGFESQNYKITQDRTINIVMTESAQSIDQVVVTGYSKVEIRKSTGSVGILKGEALRDSPLQNVDKLLQGKLAGVSVQAQSGQPGQVAKIRIRGTSSITGDSEPLWVVDGVPLQKNVPSNSSSRIRSGDFSDLFATGIGSINPSDIESINVLKDASAAAIYGSQASGGVIVVTTKHGKAGQTSISYSGNVSVQTSPSRSANLMNSTQKLAWEQELWNEYSASGYDATINGNSRHYPVIGIVGQIRSGYGDFKVWSKDQQDAYITSLGSQTTDWFDVLFRNSISTSHNISVSGGDDKTTYYISGGYSNNNGIVLRNTYDSYSVNAKIDARPNKKISYGLIADLSYQKSVAPSSNTDMFTYAYFANPYEKVFNDDGSYAADNTYYTLSNTNGSYTVPLPEDGFNIMREINETTTTAKSANMAMTANLTWHILKDLTFTGLGNFTYNNDNSDNVNGKDTYAAFTDRPFELNSFTSKRTYASITQSSSYNYSYILRGQLQYSKTFGGKHYISLLGGSEIRSSYAKSIYNKRYGYDPVSGNHSTPTYETTGDLTYDQLQSYAAIIDGLSGQSITNDAFASFYAAADYVLKNKYVFNGTVRSDGSNNFGSKEQFNATWSAGFSWNVDEEPFMKSLSDVISSMTLRTSTGYTGGVNRNVYPQFIMTYSSSFRKTDDDYYRMGFIGNAPNPHLRWEKTWDMKAALDMGFLKDRIRMSFEAYNRKGFDLVTSVNVPSSTGFSSQSYNTSEQVNRGLELTLSGTPVKVRDFSWNISGNISLNRNKLTKYNSVNGTLYGDYYVGYPQGKLFSGKVLGINSETGMYNYELRPDATIVDVSDLRKSENYLFYIGTTTAPWTGGFSTSATYKNLSLSVNGTFSLHSLVRNDISCPVNYSTVSGPSGDHEAIPTQRNDLYVNHLNVITDVTKRWTTVNHRTDGYPRLIDYYGDRLYLDRDIPSTSTITSAVYYEDVSYLKIRSLTLSYNLPSAWLMKTPIKYFGVSFSMSNLLTLTNYSGMDPETPGAVYPTSQSYSFGINVGF